MEGNMAGEKKMLMGCDKDYLIKRKR